MAAYRIPFNKPTMVGKEPLYIIQAVQGGQISGDGPFTRRCHALLQSELGVPKVLLTTSCTHALELAALLLDLEPGDEVIAPSFTFVSTVNAFLLRGARPVFVDIRPDTLNIDERLIEKLVSERTKAIVPVHYGGVGCRMDVICEIGRRRGIPVVEDNAHGLFGRFRGRSLGTFGTFAALSFHETKNFICGEGGALLINDERYIEEAEILREKGTDRSRFFRGQVDKYTWVGIGSSYLPSDVLAAYLLAQLEAKDWVMSQRKRIYEYYAEHLANWAESNGVRLPIIPDDCEQSYHMFYLLLPSPERRRTLIERLKERGILSVFHYLPLHLSPMGRRWEYRPGDCPVTEDVSERLLRLPFYNEMTTDEQAEVCRAVQEAYD